MCGDTCLLFVRLRRSPRPNTLVLPLMGRGQDMNASAERTGHDSNPTSDETEPSSNPPADGTRIVILPLVERGQDSNPSTGGMGPGQ